MKKKVYNALLKYWNTSVFKTGQEDAITAIVNNKDCLVVLPTGGGKSLCYQLPAIIKSGVCVVISPLIALMNDQVINLKEKGIRAINLSGPMREDELSLIHISEPTRR